MAKGKTSEAGTGLVSPRKRCEGQCGWKEGARCILGDEFGELMDSQ